MNRFESCPLNKTCEKSNEVFYKKRTDLKGCKNYFDCRVLSAAWKMPIERNYDKNGAYLEVNISPIISQWSAALTTYPGNISYCPVRFFTESHLEIGSWFDRDLPLPQLEMVEKDGLTLENIVAMEIKQTYCQMGFFEAVPKTPKVVRSSNA